MANLTLNEKEMHLLLTAIGHYRSYEIDVNADPEREVFSDLDELGEKLMEARGL